MIRPRTTTACVLTILAALSLLGCKRAPPPAPPAERCALIVTDDDIPSGSATAGALYIGEDELGRRLLTSDVLSVAEGFRQAGYCVVVSDSHDGAIDRKRIADRGMVLLTPSDKARWKVPFIGTHGARYRIAALVGLHARAGRQDGFRSHTVNDYVRDARMNGQPIGEAGMMMLGLGALSIPVVLVSGDAVAAEEARRFAPGIEAVSVRWRRPDGTVEFLREADAPRVLREAAGRAALRAAPRLAASFPAELAIEAHSAPRAEDALRQAGEGRGELDALLQQLGHAPFGLALRRQGAALTWTAPDALVASFSLLGVASACMPQSTRRAWPFVEKGFSAYQAKRYGEALAAYQRALAVDPVDPAHHCRIGKALLAQGRLGRARVAFRRALDELDSVVGTAMKTICLAGLAATLEKTGETEAAIEFHRKVLALPDHKGSHATARSALEHLGGG